MTCAAALAPSPEMPAASPAEVVGYYETKTEQIIRKYGPGPRIHFHTGIHDGTVEPDWSADEVRRRLVVAQEKLLEESAIAWDAPRHLSGDLLDVGCGLGGGSIFWAECFGARVTGVTIAPGHVQIARRYALESGTADRVRFELCDAHEVPGEARFDSAVAIESSCYFDRPAWFARLRQLLRPGGRVHIVDCFIGAPDAAAPFDAYWQTRIGRLAEYRAAASAAGFRELSCESLNQATRGFWDLSMAWARLTQSSLPAGASESARLDRSLVAHRQLAQGFRDGAIQYLRLVYQRA